MNATQSKSAHRYGSKLEEALDSALTALAMARHDANEAGNHYVEYRVKGLYQEALSLWAAEMARQEVEGFCE